MKFKKNPNDADCRQISLVDKEGDEFMVQAWSDGGGYDAILYVNGECFGIKRAKALKLAYAIINELDPIID
jgi:hypothetical protein